MILSSLPWAPGPAVPFGLSGWPPHQIHHYVTDLASVYAYYRGPRAFAWAWRRPFSPLAIPRDILGISIAYPRITP